MTAKATENFEILNFRFMAMRLETFGLPRDRAELWAKSVIDRARYFDRRGTPRPALFSEAHAERLAALDAQGCDPRHWI